MAKDNLFQRAKARIEEAKDIARDQHERIREDLRFSNPANPEQWRQDDSKLRDGRPTLTLDRTNQFISQVANDARQNNPGIQVIGVDNKADPKAAEILSGMIRHIEYRSRASHAYDTAIEYTARCGLNWLIVRPKVVDKATNEQEIEIGRVIDPTAAGLDPNSTEVDGRDADWGYIETRVHEKVFKQQYPKAAVVPAGDTWSSDGFVTLCEYFERETYTENRITYIDEDGNEQKSTEEEYWKLAEGLGYQPQIIATMQAECPRVRWVKMTGSEVLEETVFPSKYLPLVPVVGYELWVEGKRYLCGLTRRLMDGQRLHNFQMSAMAEFLASQPKAPFIVPAEGIEGYEDQWRKLNKGNPTHLPYNAFDDNGNPIPAPSRLAPPAMPGAYAQMAQFATQEMEASVGMYKANLGQQGNETSGRAIRARQMEGDTATFHFIDNLGRAIEQLARVVLDMIPRIYDTKRIKHILGVDGQRDTVKIDPNMVEPVKKDEKGKVIAINPNIGEYDVRVKAGPSYTSVREETAQQLADMIQAQPQLAPILGPMWARMKDMPESDRIARLLLAMAPPQVQAMENEEDDIPPRAKMQIQLLEQQMQQMQQAMDMASQKLQEYQSADREMTLKYLAESAKIENDSYKAETDRLKALQPAITVEQVAPMVEQVIAQMMAREPLQGNEELEHTTQGMAGLPDADPIGGGMEYDPSEIPEMMEPDEPLEAIGQQDNQPAQAGFFTPEGAQE
jgi:hypothetical protein